MKLASRSPRLRWILLLAAVLGTGIGVFYIARSSSRPDTSWIESIELSDDRVGVDGPQMSHGPDGSVIGPASPMYEEIRPLVDEAMAAGKRLCEQFPDDARALGLTAQMRQRFGNATEALRLWKECLQLDRGFIEAYCSIGRIFIERGEYGHAEIALRNALDLAPTSSQVSVLLANALLNQGKTEETIAVLERSAETGPATMPNFMLLGQAHIQLKEYEEAKRYFEFAVRMAPEFPNAYYGLATANARLGNRTEAIKYSKKFKELQSNELRARVDESKSYDDLRSTRQGIADMFVAIGRLYRAYGDDQAAEDQWTRAAELAPGSADSRIELAQLYDQQGRAREALDALLPLCRTHARDVNLWLRLGQLHVQLDQFDQAAEAVQEALRLEPDNPRCQQMQLLIREKM